MTKTPCSTRDTHNQMDLKFPQLPYNNKKIYSSSIDYLQKLKTEDTMLQRTL